MLRNESFVERKVAVPQEDICTRKSFEWILKFSTHVPPILEVPFASYQRDNLSGAKQFKNTLMFLDFALLIGAHI